jgi:hypothetical protein
LRSKDHQQSITVRILRGNFEGASVAFRISIAQNVDWVVVTPVSGQKLVEPAQTFQRKLRQFSAIGNQRVRGQDCWSAGVG